MKEAQQVKDIQKGIDPSTPEGLKELARRFSSVGMTAQALEVVKAARDLELKQAQTKSYEQKINSPQDEEAYSEWQSRRPPDDAPREAKMAWLASAPPKFAMKILPGLTQPYTGQQEKFRPAPGIPGGSQGDRGGFMINQDAADRAAAVVAQKATAKATTADPYEQAYQKQRGNANAKELTSLPGVTQQGEITINAIDKAIGNPTKGIKPDPGLQSYIGATLTPGFKYIEGSKEASFKALHDQILGGAFMKAYLSLKGGGQITEIEGTKGTAAITRMNKAQSEKEYIEAAKEFKVIVERGIERARSQMSGSMDSIQSKDDVAFAVTKGIISKEEGRAILADEDFGKTVGRPTTGIAQTGEVKKVRRYDPLTGTLK